MQRNSDNSVVGGNDRGAQDNLDTAGNGGEACLDNRQQRGYPSRSNLAGEDVAPADDDEISGDVRGGTSDWGMFGLQHEEDDKSSCSSTELTLGRPDPTSVHWKFSRRLLQT